MSQSRYSPLMLISATGLLQDRGLAVNAELLEVLSLYNGLDIGTRYRTLLASIIAVGLSDDNITRMQQSGKDTLPTVTNTVTNPFIDNFGKLDRDDINGLSGQVLAQANLVMGNGNLGKFEQIFSAAYGYITIVNEVINSTNSSDALVDAFINTDVLITGNAIDIAAAPIEMQSQRLIFQRLALDLQKSGKVWNLNDLDWLGFPSTLIRQLPSAGGISPALLESFTAADITPNQLADAISSKGALSLEDEASFYRAMQQITGAPFEQLCRLLDITTPGLTNMADLLNPAKMLPNSYLDLTVRVANPASPVFGDTITVPVYLPNGSVNSNLTSEFSQNNRYKSLSRVIPSDQALATRCVVRSLQQIKNIFIPSLEEFAIVADELESTEDLPIVNNLTRPMPINVSNNLLGILAIGTGPGGTVTLFDLIGSAAGVPYVELYRQLIADTLKLQDSGALLPLISESDGIWTVMQNAINNVYTVITEIPGADENDPPTILYFVEIPAGLPGTGSYGGTTDLLDALNSAFSQGLIPSAEIILNEIANDNDAKTLAERTTATVNAIVDALVREKRNLELTELDLDELAEVNRGGRINLAASLHTIGTDTGPIGAAVYFDRIVDLPTQFGQAIAAAMREGRNIESLNAVGIDLDTQIPLRPLE